MCRYDIDRQWENIEPLQFNGWFKNKKNNKKTLIKRFLCGVDAKSDVSMQLIGHIYLAFK